jgi:hypothetical protein
MRSSRLVAAFLAVACAVALIAGCSGGSGGGAAGTKGAGGASSAPAGVPAVFKTDPAAAARLTVGSSGGGAAVRLGEATAAVLVPAGAAADGAVWTITPLTEAPSGVKKPLSTGVYVDASSAPPSKPCLIGFALPGNAPKNATIVRISDDGKSTEIVPTNRITAGGRTLLTASVDGFSPYTTSEEDKAAIDKAFVDRAKARGKQVDFTIKAGGKEAQTNEGWTFNYEFDLFASGGGVDVGGLYKGHAMLSVDGKYKGPASIVKSFGKLSGIGRDQNLQFWIVDASLADLLTGESVGDPTVAGAGTMNLKGMGSLDISAVGPTARGRYNKNNVKGSGGVPFTILVNGDDVQIEIPKVGIFPGKILRTTK